MASKSFNDCHFWGNENASEYLVNRGMENNREISMNSRSVTVGIDSTREPSRT